MTITVSNGTITISKSGIDPVKLNSILAKAAEYYYNVYPILDSEGKVIPFSALTNAQKLALIEKHTWRVHQDAAKTQAANAAINLARSEAAKEDLEL